MSPQGARGQNGVSGSYMHDVFDLAQSVRDLDMFTTYFY